MFKELAAYRFSSIFFKLSRCDYRRNIQQLAVPLLWIQIRLVNTTPNRLFELYNAFSFLPQQAILCKTIASRWSPIC